jgi:hypothetical protein
MQRAKQLKNADQILKRLLSTLEYPYAMQQMLAADDFQSVLSIYRRVQSLPVSSGLRIVKRIINRSDVIMFEMKQKIMSILLSPSPVLPVLSRLVKILHEMEDEENCRLILQQCYDKQIQSFEDQIKSLVNKSCEELMRAYMKGQEINLMNKDPSLRATGGDNSPKSKSQQRKGITTTPSTSVPVPVMAMSYLNPVDSNVPMRRKTAASIRFAAARRRQSQSMESLSNEAMRSLSLYEGLDENLFNDSPERNNGRLYGDEYGGVGISGDYLSGPEGDTDYDQEDDLSDVASVTSSDSKGGGGGGGGGGVYFKKSDEEDAQLLLQYQDPQIDYSEYFCKKVRIKMTRQLIDLIDLWLPSVHRLLMLLTAAPQLGATAAATGTATGGGAAAAGGGAAGGGVIGGNSMKASPQLVNPTKRGSVSLPNRVLQTTYGRNQSVASQAKQLGDVLVTCAEAIRGSILGFKGKYLSPYITDMVSRSIFSQEFMQTTLREPHLSTTVMEISEVYDVIESVLMETRNDLPSPATAAGLSNNFFLTDDLDSINFFGSTAYRDSIHMLRALAEDGENTIAKKTMEQLVAQSLILTSKATKTLTNTSASATASAFAAGGLSRSKSSFPLELEDPAVASLADPSKSSRSIDEIVRIFEIHCVKRLRRLVEIVRRPDWVASTVWDHIQRLLDRFISSLALFAGGNSGDSKKHLEVTSPSSPTLSSPLFLCPVSCV